MLENKAVPERERYMDSIIRPFPSSLKSQFPTIVNILLTLISSSRFLFEKKKRGRRFTPWTQPRPHFKPYAFTERLRPIMTAYSTIALTFAAAMTIPIGTVASLPPRPTSGATNPPKMNDSTPSRAEAVPADFA